MNVYIVATSNNSDGAETKMIGVYEKNKTAEQVKDAYNQQQSIEENQQMGYAQVFDMEVKDAEQAKEDIAKME